MSKSPSRGVRIQSSETPLKALTKHSLRILIDALTLGSFSRCQNAKGSRWGIKCEPCSLSRALMELKPSDCRKWASDATQERVARLRAEVVGLIPPGNQSVR